MANVELQKVEVEFRDLTKEAQERLYLSNKEKFKNEAANSMYISIRRMVAENEDSSSEFLNAMFREELTNKYKQNEDVINDILSNPKFTMEEETRKLCAESGYWKYREIVAKDENSSSEFLNAMLREEITNKDKQSNSIVHAILANPKFTMDEETKKLCAESDNWEYRIIAAEDKGSSSKFLNAMLREEITNEEKQDEDVIKAILSNPKFTMEEETRKLCAESDNWECRIIAAENKGSSSEFLNAMLREEITNEDKQDKDVIKAILSNKNLLLQDDLRNACAEFNNWEVRLIIAKDVETPKKLLEAMSKGEENGAVKDAINTNFSYKEKNKQMLEVLKGYFSSENQAVECLKKIKAIIY